MNYHIYGKGFGLYGYLAAIIKIKLNKIFIQKDYYSFIKSRKDLKKYINKITFVNKHDLKNNDVVIYAKRPSDQYKFIKKNASRKLYFFLEKPLAENYKKSKELISFLNKKKINFSIGYLFLYSSWYSKVNKLLLNKDIKELSINWYFNSVNKLSSWKNKNIQGGGLINFYGIQILALMTSLEFNFCISSKIYRKNKRDFMWCSEFKNKKNKKFIIKLIINSKHTNFDILYLLKKNKKDLTKILYKNKFPFKKKYKNDDYRVDAIRKYINNSIRLKNRKLIYFKILSLWNKVNKKTKLIKL